MSPHTPTKPSLPAQKFSTAILLWYHQKGRKHLPWQFKRTGQHTAYGVWISEIMLQQTQVNTVIPYFQRFITQFPTLVELAQAPIDHVLHLWSGLGYYARARHLHKAAQHLIAAGGRFPKTLETLMQLPGIGRSTAGAILSLGLGVRAPILDGNVKRVLCRFHSIEGWPGDTQVQQRLWQLAECYTPTQNFKDYNQAMMDMGALVCTRSKPDCHICPLQKYCAAYHTQKTSTLPASKPRKDRPVRNQYGLVFIAHHGKVWLQQRKTQGIWGGLWSLPEWPSLDAMISASAAFQKTKPQKLPLIQHEFTHFKLNFHPYLLKLSSQAQSRDANFFAQGHWYDLKNPTALGLAAPIQKLLQTL